MFWAEIWKISEFLSENFHFFFGGKILSIFDRSVILDGSENSLRETLNVLHDFSIISGLKVNFDKTQVVWIGKEKFGSATIKTRWKLSWDKTDFKLLGIKFHVDLEKITDINFKEKIQKIKSLIKIWERSEDT